jgi:hypothetical protein
VHQAVHRDLDSEEYLRARTLIAGSRKFL